MSTMVLHRSSRRIQPSPASTDRRGADAPSMRSRTPVVDSRALLAGQREVLIEHAGEVYRLRHTRNDRLILTK